MEKEYGSPLITNDGVSIAKEIELEDKFENMGAKLVYEVANKTNDTAGDGTTTATILAQSMIENGLKAVEKGANPVLMREGIEYGKQGDRKAHPGEIPQGGNGKRYRFRCHYFCRQQ